MKLQSPKQRSIGKCLLGGPQYLVCLPLTAHTRGEITDQATRIGNLKPDLVEWRVDGFEHVDTIDRVLLALGHLRDQLPEVPLIFTCRADFEGGQASLAPSYRIKLISEAIASGRVDLLDIELATPTADLEAIIAMARARGVGVILSQHDFAATPPEDHIRGTLEAMQSRGADVAKIAVTPKSPSDVLTLLTATLAARQGPVEIPMITIAMGSLGALSRIAGGLFGSDMTFAAGPTVSAPGQLPIADLRQAMAPLY